MVTSHEINFKNLLDYHCTYVAGVKCTESAKFIVLDNCYVYYKATNSL